MKKLYRYPDEGMIGGVCEGLGRYLNVEPGILRIVWCALIIGLGVGLFAYIVAWICIPELIEEE
jgi:phage shock protein C